MFQASYQNCGKSEILKLQTFLLTAAVQIQRNKKEQNVCIYAKL